MNSINLEIQSSKKIAIITGLCFIFAAVTSIFGKLLYEPVLINPDYLTLGVKSSSQIILGAFFELLLACTAIGTSVALYPILRKSNEVLAMGYVIFRALEVVFILIGLVSVLALLTLSQTYTDAASPNSEQFKIVGTILKGIHDWTFILGPNFMLGVNTFIYSFAFLKSKLIPQKLAIFGTFAAIMIFIASLLEMFGIIKQVSAAGILIALPIFFYEMTLATWLIWKGFTQDRMLEKSLIP